MYNTINENFIYNVFKRILKENDTNNKEQQQNQKKALIQRKINELLAKFKSILLDSNVEASESTYIKEKNIICQKLLNQTNTNTNYVTFLNSDATAFSALLETYSNEQNKSLLTQFINDIQASNNADFDFKKFINNIQGLKNSDEIDEGTQKILDNIIKANMAEELFKQDLITSITALNNNQFKIKILNCYRRLINFAINSAINISMKYKGLIYIENKISKLNNFFNNDNNKLMLDDTDKNQKKIDFSKINANILKFCENVFQTSVEITTKKGQNTEGPPSKKGKEIYSGFMDVLTDSEINILKKDNQTIIFNTEQGKQSAQEKTELYCFAVIYLFEKIFDIIKEEIHMHESFKVNSNNDHATGFKKIKELGAELNKNSDNHILELNGNNIIDIEKFIKKINAGFFDLIKNGQYTARGKNLRNTFLGVTETARAKNQTTNDNKYLVYLTPTNITASQLQFKPFSGNDKSQQRRYIHIANSLINGQNRGVTSNIDFNDSPAVDSNIRKFAQELFTYSRKSLELLSIDGIDGYFNQLKRIFYTKISDPRILGQKIEEYMNNKKTVIFQLDLASVQYIYNKILSDVFKYENVKNELELYIETELKQAVPNNFVDMYINGVSIMQNKKIELTDIFKQEQAQ